MTRGHPNITLSRSNIQRLHALSPWELKVLYTILSLADDKNRLTLPLSHLAKEADMGYRRTNLAVLSLYMKEFIFYSAGKNQWQDSYFEVASCIGYSVREEASDQADKNRGLRIRENLGRKASSSNIDYIDIYSIDKNAVDKRVEKYTVRNFRPRTEREELALRIAEALNDRKGLGLYLSYCRKYSRPVIWKAFATAKEIPPDKIRKTRGALFTYLVKKYAQEDH